MKRQFRADEGGQTVVLVALMFIMLLGFVALSVDVGRFYAERRFIQDAVDSASLACAAKYASTGVALDGWNAGHDILEQRNLLRNPLGITVTYPDVWADPLVYDGPAIDLNLSGGIKPINGSQGLGCRVAITVDVPTLFIRVVNPSLPTIRVITRSYAIAKGGMFPVVINRYKNPPGPGGNFLDYTKQETYQTVNPNACGQDDYGACPNAAYSPITCPLGCLWGPETVIVGQGYSASDSDFRGFIGLDVRDFTSTFPDGSPEHQYYNNSEGLNTNQLKDQEAAYILMGGYPGPDLVAFVPGSNPVQRDLQIAAMSGNSAGVVVDDFNKYFRQGDLILTQVFDGQVRIIPDFTIDPIAPIPATSPSGPSSLANFFRVGANQKFRADNSTVTLSMIRDTYNGTLSDTPTQLTPDFGFNPSGAFTPAGGAGTNITIQDLRVTSGLPSGIYSVIVEGVGRTTAGVETSRHRQWVPLNIGSVARDFSLTFNSVGLEVVAGTNAVFVGSLNTETGGLAWNGSPVVLEFDRGTTCSIGQAAAVQGATTECRSVTITSNPAGFIPAKNGPPTITITLPTDGLDGAYSLILRARGVNGATPAQPVVHVYQMQLYVNTLATGTNKTYVNIQGYVVFEVTRLTTNTVYGRAVSRAAADPNDPDLATAKRIRLVPWEEP